MDDEINSLSDESVVDCYENKQDDEEKIEIPIIIRKSQKHQPMLIDATETTMIQTRNSKERLKKIPKERSLWKFIRTINYFSYLIVIIGIVITVSSTYVNIRNTIRYVRFTSPCIFNTTTK